TESRGFVSSGDSPQMMPSPVREPFTPILKVVIKEVQESLGESSNSLIESGSAKGATSLLMPSVKLVPPPKKEDRGRLSKRTAKIPEPPPIEAFGATWKYRPVKEDTLSAQQTVMPAFTIQIVGDMEQGPPPRPGHNPGAVQKVPEGNIPHGPTAAFPCNFDKEFDMKSFQETQSFAGELAHLRGRSPSTRTARPRTPERNVSSPTSYQTQGASNFPWTADEFDFRSYDRATTYDSKSTFTAMSTGSFEGQDPFNRTQQGNFVVPPSMATRIQKPDGALPVIPKSNIVVMGGLNLDTGITGSVVAFDPSFNTVQQCGTLPTPLHHHRAVLSGSDIFVVGGMLESTEGLYVCSKRCYKLSVPTLQWTRVADLKTERAHHGIVLLPGRILVFGGLTLGRKLLSSMEYYDIKRNKWTKMKSSLPQATMAMGAALFRSLVWIAGGVVDSGSNNLDCSSAVQCYSPETKAWTFMAPTLPMSCGYLSLVSDGSSLLAVGGSVSLDQLQLGSVPDVYALSADQRTWEPMPSLPRPCHSSAAVAFGQRANLYVFGGISNGNVLADVQVLQKGRWTTCAHLQATLLGLSAVALPPAHATPPELDLLDKGRRDDDLIVWSWHNL
ncbi:unnamed protein product, partial [Ixodes pacificus]